MDHFAGFQQKDKLPYQNYNMFPPTVNPLAAKSSMGCGNWRWKLMKHISITIQLQLLLHTDSVHLNFKSTSFSHLKIFLCFRYFDYSITMSCQVFIYHANGKTFPAQFPVKHHSFPLYGENVSYCSILCIICCI